MKIRRFPLYATRRVKKNPQHLCWKKKNVCARCRQDRASGRRIKGKTIWCFSPLVAYVIVRLWFGEARPMYHGSIARARSCLLFFLLRSILFSSCFSGEGCNGNPPGTLLLMALLLKHFSW
ncbi:unnamed protein product [Ectocarpus sp. 12 AP-2014]